MSEALITLKVYSDRIEVIIGETGETIVNRIIFPHKRDDVLDELKETFEEIATVIVERKD